MCAFPDCERDAVTAGLCIGHYGQKHRGEELRVLRRTPIKSIRERITTNTVIDEHSGCWVWTAFCNKHGYALTTNQFGKTEHAHRVSYREHCGDIPEGTVVHHTCANRACVNPAHLQTVTPQENTAEMVHRQAMIRRIEELEARLALYESGAA